MLANPQAAAIVLADLRAYSASQTRSQQVRIGMSEVGGCDRALWSRITEQPTTNPDTQVLAALRGTAVHTVLEQALGDGALVETEVSYRGVLGHVDHYRDGMVTDFKTKDAKGMAAVRQYGADRSYTWQLALYGAGLRKRGYAVTTLRLVYIGVSSPDDVYVLQMPFDQAIADQAIEHYNSMVNNVYTGVIPEPGRDAVTFCRLYCGYHDATGAVGCPGRTSKATEYVSLGDVWGEVEPSAQAALDYRAGMVLAAEGHLLKETARQQLLGSRGVVAGLAVSWSDPQPKDVPDGDAALLRLTQLGEPVPMTTTCATPRISVKPIVTA